MPAVGGSGRRTTSYYTRISKPTAQERWRGGATRCGRVFCLLPGQFGQGVSTLTLRRATRLMGTAMQAQFRKYRQVGFSPPYTEGRCRFNKERFFAVLASAFPCRGEKDAQNHPGFHGYASKCGADGVRPRSRCAADAPRAIKNHPVMTRYNCCLSAENSDRVILHSDHGRSCATLYSSHSLLYPSQGAHRFDVIRNVC